MFVLNVQIVVGVVVIIEKYQRLLMACRIFHRIAIVIVVVVVVVFSVE